MLRFHNRFYWRTNRLRRSFLFIGILTIIITSIHYLKQYYKIHLNASYNGNNGLDIITDHNHVLSISYFNHEESEFNIVNDIDHKTKTELESTSLINRCVNYINETLQQTDSVTVNDHETLLRTIEQLRIYDYCFISGKLEFSAVLNRITRKDMVVNKYYERTFPYLSFYENSSDPMSPTLYHMTEKGKEVVSLPVDTNDIQKFNQNFWLSWSSQSKGKGIVITMGKEDVNMLKKLLAVLKVLNNSLPIQIVTTGNDFGKETMVSLSQLAKKYDQDIYVIDCSNILNKKFTKERITGFLNKWVAILFSTFEEALLIDLDSVPYIMPVKFFDIESYKQTGIYMYRDREILVVDNKDACLNKFLSLSHSDYLLEIDNFKFPFQRISQNEIQKDDASIKTQLTMEEIVFKNFFREGNMHQVDSGLIIVNRKKQLPGLLMGFALHLSEYFDECVHGDKEFFWLGPLFAGSDYSIDPNYAGTMGTLYKNENNIDGICATQIAHINKKNDLMWSNGGLNICKFKNAAIKDFEIYGEFFKSRYNDPESLQKIYDSPLFVEGVIIPEVDDIQWMQTRECNQFRFCAYFKEKPKSTTISSHHGSIIRFNQEKRDFYSNIAKIWSEN